MENYHTDQLAFNGKKEIYERRKISEGSDEESSATD